MVDEKNDSPEKKDEPKKKTNVPKHTKISRIPSRPGKKKLAMYKGHELKKPPLYMTQKRALDGRNDLLIHIDNIDPEWKYELHEFEHCYMLRVMDMSSQKHESRLQRFLQKYYAPYTKDRPFSFPQDLRSLSNLIFAWDYPPFNSVPGEWLEPPPKEETQEAEDETSGDTQK